MQIESRDEAQASRRRGVHPCTGDTYRLPSGLLVMVEDANREEVYCHYRDKTPVSFTRKWFVKEAWRLQEKPLTTVPAGCYSETMQVHAPESV